MTDVRLGNAVLRESSRDALEAEARRTGSAAAERRLRRYDYHASLLKSALPQSFELNLALRKIDPRSHTAFFTVTLDRYDITESVFVRYTIHLAQTADRWRRQQVELVGDDLAYTENFRNAISRFAADEAEFAFILLSDLPNVKVEEVVRGRVGPMYFRGVQMPEEWKALFDTCPDAFVLHFPSDSASLSLARSGSADPLATLYGDFLKGEARQALDEKIRFLGYKVWKERKFTCTADVEAPLRDLLRRRGSPSVVRSITSSDDIV